ncbi:MAG: hypothetical protein ACOYL3_07535, partial [Desulfuromonadaceae bacterium]
RQVYKYLPQTRLQPLIFTFQPVILFVVYSHPTWLCLTPEAPKKKIPYPLYGYGICETLVLILFYADSIMK